MRKIVKISIFPMTESCERTTYYVRLDTDEGFHTEPCAHRTGHAYMDDGVRVEVPGLSKEEALQRALSDAGDWSDLLQIPMEPYIEDGAERKAAWDRNRFTNEREMIRRRRERMEKSIAEAGDEGDGDQNEEA